MVNSMDSLSAFEIAKSQTNRLFDISFKYA